MEKLNIVAAPAAQVTDFIDVELNLATGKFKPYRNPIDSPVYINANSNHPKTITDQLPKMIEHHIFLI